MSIQDYADWNEEASIMWARENDFDSPMCDESDANIKQRIYDMSDDEFEDWTS